MYTTLQAGISQFLADSMIGVDIEADGLQWDIVQSWLNVCHITAQSRSPVQRLVEKLGREMWGPITEAHTDGDAFAGLYLGSR